MISRKLIALTAVGGLSLTLAACGDSADTDTTTVVPTTDATAAATADPTTENSTESSSATAMDGEDPVFPAIDAVLAEYAEGVITDIDREDSTDVYDIDVVVGQEVIDLVVNASTGELREEGRESTDADDEREVAEATVTAADAITRALEQHPDGVLDEISLDEDNGNIQWDIDLDDVNRNDLTELHIPAN